MKFIYVDESGGRDQSDVFVMVGLLVDAYRLRRKTTDFDELLKDLLQRHPGHRDELKTKQFINGGGGWSAVPPEERKQFLRDICTLAADGGKLFGVGISFENFDAAIAAGHNHLTGNSYWLAAGLFITALIQKKMQPVSSNKGLTVLVMDDNKREMPKLSDLLYTADPWLDGLYQMRRTVRGRSVWKNRTAADRLDQIINTAFAVKSEHSSLVQVSDALSYIYRRHLELRTEADAYAGESDFYDELVGIIDPRREKLGQTPSCEALNFYRAATHDHWQL